MLHILLMILKIIGILLLCIIGVLLLVIALVLFVPLRYRIKASKEDTIYANAKITWLCHIVSVRVEYKEEVLCKVKIFGIPFYDLSKADEKAEKKAAKQKAKEAKQRAKEAKRKAKEAKSAAAGSRKLSGADGTSGAEVFSETSKASKAEQKKSASGNRDANMTSAGEQDSQGGEQSPESQTEEVPHGLFAKIKLFITKIKEWFFKILQFFRNIKYTFEQFCDKIKSTARQISYYKEVWEREETKQAFAVCKKQLGRLLKHLKPLKFQTYMHIGLSDPATLGQILSVHGMLYPLIGKNVRIVPDFENEVLEGNIFIKGRITVFVLLRTAWILYFDKNIKYLIRLLKKEEK